MKCRLPNSSLVRATAMQTNGNDDENQFEIMCFGIVKGTARDWLALFSLFPRGQLLWWITWTPPAQTSQRSLAFRKFRRFILKTWSPLYFSQTSTTSQQRRKAGTPPIPSTILFANWHTVNRPAEVETFHIRLYSLVICYVYSMQILHQHAYANTLSMKTAHAVIPVFVCEYFGPLWLF